MPELAPATRSQWLLSQVNPKRLAVRMRMRSLPDWSVQFTPVFAIDDCSVASSEITTAEEQTIRGYRVRLTSDILHIVRTSGGKAFSLPHSEATAYLQALQARGIVAISEDGSLLGNGQQAALHVSLSLAADDSLRIESRLLDSESKELEKPLDLGEVRRDSGWLLAGGEMVRLELTGTGLDEILFQEDGNCTVTGRRVPQVLKAVALNAGKFASLKKNALLERLAVWSGTASYELEVSGDVTGIRIDTRLVIRTGTGRDFRCSDDTIDLAPPDKTAYLRIAEGWLEVNKEILHRYRAVRDALPVHLPCGREIRGSKIPDALLAIRSLGPSAAIWKISTSQGVKTAHQLEESSPDLGATVERVARHGAISFLWVPQYSYGWMSLTHAEVTTALQAQEKWLRRDGAWVRLDRESHARVEMLLQSQGQQLVADSEGFLVPPAGFEALQKEFSLLGSVQDIPFRGELLKVDVAATLQADETLRVEATLLTADGRSVATQEDWETIQREDGWFAAGNELMRLPLTRSVLDETFFRDGSFTFPKERVPAVLRLLESIRGQIKTLTKNAPLRSLRVCTGKLEQRLRIAEEGDGIRLEPQALIQVDGTAPVALSADTIDCLIDDGSHFVRVPQGWVQVTGNAVPGFLASCGDLDKRFGTTRGLTGIAIPQTLLELHQLATQERQSFGWRIDVASSVAQRHQIINAPASVTAVFTIDSREGRPEAEVRVLYRHGTIDLTPTEVETAISGIARRENHWAKVDKKKVAEVARACSDLKMSRHGERFRVPLALLAEAEQAFALIGNVERAAVKEAKIDLSLSLEPGDLLRVGSRLVLGDGNAVSKRLSLATLREDEGFAVVDEQIIHVKLADPAVEEIVFEEEAPATLAGEDVPRFLLHIAATRDLYHDVHICSALESLDVLEATGEHRLVVRGDSGSLTVEPQLRLRTQAGAFYDLPTQGEEGRLKAVPEFRRIPEGWISTRPTVVSEFQAFARRAALAIPLNHPIRGAGIPAALRWVYSSAAGSETAGSVDISASVAEAHQITEAPGSLELAFEQSAEAGRVCYTLLPSYRHQAQILAHEAVEAAVRSGHDWVRCDGGWVLIDRSAYGLVVGCGKRLGLQCRRGGFAIETSQKQQAMEAFGQLATISEIVCRARRADLQVSLALQPDDSLKVESRLMAEDGREIPKPESLAIALQDGGWLAVDDELFKLPLSATPLDEVLLEKNDDLQLTGGDVPQFLKNIPAAARENFQFIPNERLVPLQILQGMASQHVSVVGDMDWVRIEPSLRIETEAGPSVDVSDDQMMGLPSGEEGFVRCDGGWVEVGRAAINSYKRSRNRLWQMAPIGKPLIGAAIPEALTKLNVAATSTGPWNVYYAAPLAAEHKIVDVPANITFQLNIVESDGASLLRLDPLYDHDRFQFSHRESREFAKAGQQWARRGASWVRIDSKAFQRVQERTSDSAVSQDEDGFGFRATARESVLKLFSALGTVRHTQAYVAFLQKLADFDQIEEVPLPGNLRPEVVLRSYQQHGYNWLAFMQRFGLNGILADDMGLGKTLQTLAVIEHAREMNATGPALIICPTSVVHNWRAEIDRFLRTAHVVMLHGSNRVRQHQEIERVANFRTGSAYVITSYDIAMRDHGQLSRIPWLYLVVDEGHHIKNPTAKRTRAIKTLPGQHKLALTGTPIQNRLGELWSLFDFAMPGFLGTQKEFRDEFADGDDVDWAGVSEELMPRVRPFIMRRLKQDVAKDLPEKLIVEHEIELTPKQVSLYKQFLQGSEYRRLVSEVEEKGVGRSQTHIFAVMMRLRNICNHPLLAEAEWAMADMKSDDSGKLAFLKNLMEEVVEGEHRALLFSRSTRMLDILEHFMEKWGIRCVRLDGQTPSAERARIVDEFNSTQEITCFLLSMAGNTGINLTSADTVIFYDHDWNPANDNQAMDRAHRIGQTKQVTVYKLISKGTIEERIIARQKIKQTLADEVIGTDTAGFKNLTKEELLSLFSLDE